MQSKCIDSVVLRGLYISDCGMPEPLVNGTISLDTNGETTYLSTASVSCDTGFNMSTNSISCEASGKWQAVSCVIKGDNYVINYVIQFTFMSCCWN